MTRKVRAVKATSTGEAQGNQKGATRRLAPEVRERQIVLKAVDHFATHGFSGSTRELARQLGVTPPLLSQYSPSKH
jgi:AcrR family transcriptional regulator|nr:TetR/AcrR family transcriptional regulator [Paraburkholderia hospita]